MAVEPLGIPVAEQGGHNPDTTAAIVAAGRRVVSGGGAEALVLACGGMADVAQTVRREVGVPVCDGVAFGAMIAYALWRCGLTTSKAGGYGWPEPIAYSGMPGFRNVGVERLDARLWTGSRLRWGCGCEQSHRGVLGRANISYRY